MKSLDSPMRGDTDSAIASISEGGRGYEARTALAKITTSLLAGNEDQAKTVYNESTARGKSSMIYIIVVGVVIILVSGHSVVCNYHRYESSAAADGEFDEQAIRGRPKP